MSSIPERASSMVCKGISLRTTRIRIFPSVGKRANSGMCTVTAPVASNSPKSEETVPTPVGLSSSSEDSKNRLLGCGARRVLAGGLPSSLLLVSSLRVVFGGVSSRSRGTLFWNVNPAWLNFPHRSLARGALGAFGPCEFFLAK